MNINRYINKHQTGATLIVCLVLLLIITVLGLASVRSSNMELKMTASARDKAIAFEAAESALRKIENNLSTTPPLRKDMLPDCDASVATNQCFKRDCTGGLCFRGAVIGNKCVSFSNDTVPSEKNANLWRNKTVWEDTAFHKTITVEGGQSDEVKNRVSAKSVKYIIEFLCMVPRVETDTEKNKLVVNSGTEEGDGTVPLYRITALATGDSNRASVMLQSVYKNDSF